MNISSANALLKLLEEPNADSVLILVSDDPTQLPQTIRSRCIPLKCAVPVRDIALQWLSQQVNSEDAHKALVVARGAPLSALNLVRAEHLKDFEQVLGALANALTGRTGVTEASRAMSSLQTPETTVNWLQLILSWVMSILSEALDEEIEQAFGVYLQPLSGCFTSNHSLGLFQAYDELARMQQQDLGVINFGMQMDKWLIGLTQRLARKSA